MDIPKINECGELFDLSHQITDILYPISDFISCFFLCQGVQNERSVQYAARGLPRPVFIMAECPVTHAEHSSEEIQGVEKQKSVKLTKTVQLAIWSTSSALLADIDSA